MPPDCLNERIALEVKRQLEAAGVDMAIEELTQDQLIQRLRQARLRGDAHRVDQRTDAVPPYLVWHSGGPFNWGHFGSPDNRRRARRVFATLHPMTITVRRSPAFKQAFVDDPPAIFLAWRNARAPSAGGSTVPSEHGRDILSTLRLWKPAADTPQASRN